jgi:hypothetical protein
MEMRLTNIVVLKNERDKRIIRKALAMQPTKPVVGYCSSSDGRAYIQAVWEAANP